MSSFYLFHPEEMHASLCKPRATIEVNETAPLLEAQHDIAGKEADQWQFKASDWILIATISCAGFLNVCLL